MNTKKPGRSRETCAACGNVALCEHHHLLAQVDAGPDTPTVPLCNVCHAKMHVMKPRPNNLAALIQRGRLINASRHFYTRKSLLRRK